MNVCLNCNQKTSNPKFCGRSCAAKHNNKKNPKRKRNKWYCLTCKTETLYRRKYCDKCNPLFIDWSQVTYSDIISKRAYQKHSRIRDLSRSIYNKSGKPKQCFICGYNINYEICHIKPIKDFQPNSLITEINHIDNLVALCPNHHWELDNGIITI